ncbi:hypothetical protein R3P38DRAFT_2759611 [Favolaschia claudopus]|uniref:Uncharacterized protein n=1 Tax=Favolaschia claudopus TaxID=2862362 RepID=A0AAW0E0S1_9AGAR
MPRTMKHRPPLIPAGTHPSPPQSGWNVHPSSGSDWNAPPPPNSHRHALPPPQPDGNAPSTSQSNRPAPPSRNSPVANPRKRPFLEEIPEPSADIVSFPPPAWRENQFYSPHEQVIVPGSDVKWSRPPAIEPDDKNDKPKRFKLTEVNGLLVWLETSKNPDTRSVAYDRRRSRALHFDGASSAILRGVIEPGRYGMPVPAFPFMSKRDDAAVPTHSSTWMYTLKQHQGSFRPPTIPTAATLRKPPPNPFSVGPDAEDDEDGGNQGDEVAGLRDPTSDELPTNVVVLTGPLQRGIRDLDDLAASVDDRSHRSYRGGVRTLAIVRSRNSYWFLYATTTQGVIGAGLMVYFGQATSEIRFDTNEEFLRQYNASQDRWKHADLRLPPVALSPAAVLGEEQRQPAEESRSTSGAVTPAFRRVISAPPPFPKTPPATRQLPPGRAQTPLFLPSSREPTPYIGEGLREIIQPLITVHQPPPKRRKVQSEHLVLEEPPPRASPAPSPSRADESKRQSSAPSAASMERQASPPPLPLARESPAPPRSPPRPLPREATPAPTSESGVLMGSGQAESAATAPQPVQSLPPVEQPGESIPQENIPASPLSDLTDPPGTPPRPLEPIAPVEQAAQSPPPSSPPLREQRPASAMSDLTDLESECEDLSLTTVEADPPEQDHARVHNIKKVRLIVRKPEEQIATDTSSAQSTSSNTHEVLHTHGEPWDAVYHAVFRAGGAQSVKYSLVQILRDLKTGVCTIHGRYGFLNTEGELIDYGPTTEGEAIRMFEEEYAEYESGSAWEQRCTRQRQSLSSARHGKYYYVGHSVDEVDIYPAPEDEEDDRLAAEENEES